MRKTRLPVIPDNPQIPENADHEMKQALKGFCEALDAMREIIGVWQSGPKLDRLLTPRVAYEMGLLRIKGVSVDQTGQGYLDDVALNVTIPEAQAPVASGSVAEVVSDTLASPANTTGATWVELAQVDVAFDDAAQSVIFVTTADLTINTAGFGSPPQFRIYNDTDASEIRTKTITGSEELTAYDAPAASSTVTYKLQGRGRDDDVDFTAASLTALRIG